MHSNYYQKSINNMIHLKKCYVYYTANRIEKDTNPYLFPTVGHLLPQPQKPHPVPLLHIQPANHPTQEQGCTNTGNRGNLVPGRPDI